MKTYEEQALQQDPSSITAGISNAFSLSEAKPRAFGILSKVNSKIFSAKKCWKVKVVWWFKHWLSALLLVELFQYPSLMTILENYSSWKPILKAQNIQKYYMLPEWTAIKTVCHKKCSFKAITLYDIINNRRTGYLKKTDLQINCLDCNICFQCYKTRL